MTAQTAPGGDDPAAFVEELFGMEDKGFIVLAFIPNGGGPASHAHIPVGRWDIAEREIAHHAAGHNCYVAVALYASAARKVAGKMQHRTKEMVGHCRWLYADLDGARAPATLPEPTILIETSPGRLQAWWRLIEPVGVRRAEDLLRRISRACGIGNEAVDATRILRIPGTPNRKAGRPDAIVRRVGGSGESVPDAPFARLPEPSYSPSNTLSGPVAHVAVDAGDLARGKERLAANDMPPALLRLLRGENPSRDPSSGDHAAVCGLMEIGLSDAEACAVFADSARGAALADRKGEHRVEYLMDHLISSARAKIPAQQVISDVADAAEVISVDQTAERRYRLYTADEIKSRPPVSFRVEGLIPEGSLCGLIGNPGTYKTFVALDLALSIATGLPWHGREVGQGRIVFVSAEGAAGLGQRIAAWEQRHYQEADGEHFRVITDAPQLLDGADVHTLIASIGEAMEAPDGIFVDTLARTFDGEENSSQDMGAYIRALDRLRQTFSCFVCPIHHSNAAGLRARGSSAFLAALDVEMTLTRDGETVTMAVTKAKDFSEGEPLLFAKEVVDLGGHVSSLVLESKVQNGSVPSSIEARVLTILMDVFGVEGTTSSAWEKTCAEAGIAHTYFHRAKTGLLSRGLVSGPPSGRYIRGFRYIPQTPHSLEGTKVHEGTPKVHETFANEGTNVRSPLRERTFVPSDIGRPVDVQKEEEEDDLF